jgi:NAD+ kinase
MTIRTLALVVNRAKPGTETIVAEISRVCSEVGVTLREVAWPIDPKGLRGADACCVVGGDGTFLGVAETAAREAVPMFGINRGKLGFLAAYPAEDVAASLRSVLAGHARREERAMLEIAFADGTFALALNDLVIKTRDVFRMSRLGVQADGSPVNTYRADGLIVATPTGSSAYNLAAGGPLIDPAATVIALTPLCAHTLSNQPLIFSAEAELRIESLDAVPLGLSVDGRPTLDAAKRLPLIVRTAKVRLGILRPSNLSHFDVLRSKLHWA